MVAGANSIFYGEALLTTPNVTVNEDDTLFAALAPLSGAQTPIPS
jgi:biotin synthase